MELSARVVPLTAGKSSVHVSRETSDTHLPGLRTYTPHPRSRCDHTECVSDSGHTRRNHEEDLPAQEAQTRQDPWLSRQEFVAWRQGDTQAATQEGPPPALGLILASGRNQSRRGRLSRSADFDRVYRSGDSKGNRYLVVHAFPRGGDSEGPPRLGISVGKKVGNAVRRNRVKRVIREEFWALEPRISPDSDYVVVARPDLGNLLDSEGSQAVRAQIDELLPPPASEERNV